jgi:RNA polymerase sigma-70 factor (ECF subfamily)
MSALATAPSSTRVAAKGRRLDPASLGDHVDRLYRAARAMSGSREEAEDLVQETFARVLQRPRFLHCEDDIGYLLRVLRNTFVSGRRRAARRPQRSDAPDELMWIEDLSAPQPEARLDHAALYQAIAALPASFRDALVAVDVLGLSYEEASRALLVREATINTRLHRARQRVAAALAQDSGITPAVRRAPLEATAGRAA